MRNRFVVNIFATNYSRFCMKIKWMKLKKTMQSSYPWYIFSIYVRLKDIETMLYRLMLYTICGSIRFCVIYVDINICYKTVYIYLDLIFTTRTWRTIKTIILQLWREMGKNEISEDMFLSFLHNSLLFNMLLSWSNTEWCNIIGCE